MKLNELPKLTESQKAGVRLLIDQARSELLAAQMTRASANAKAKSLTAEINSLRATLGEVY